jgi:hypothetical protein
MKVSWIFFIVLLVFVAVFSVQNAEPMTVRFLAWEITMSAALVIQLAALLGGLVGLSVRAWSLRTRPVGDETPTSTTPHANANETQVPPATPHSI